MSTKPDPAPKPDHIRSLRDLAANFVRAIDRSALEFEGTATADLTERVACLVALHDLEGTDLAKIATKDLRSRLNLLRQTERAEKEVDYSTRQSTNGELKKRIEYLRQFTEVKNADDISSLNDEAVEALHAQTDKIIRLRKAQAKAKAQAEARVAAFKARNAVLVPAADESFEEEDVESDAA